VLGEGGLEEGCEEVVEEVGAGADREDSGFREGLRLVHSLAR